MTNTIHLTAPATCSECGFSTADINLLAHHSCDIQQGGGRCEDYPACGHEAGDCNGLLYGSDEAIKASVYEAIRTGHGECAHEEGLYLCQGDPEDEDRDEDDDLDYWHMTPEGDFKE